MLSALSRNLVSRSLRPVAGVRNFSGYAGMTVTDEELVRKHDDWVIEETNFCLGRVSHMRYLETEDMARRAKRTIESQRCYMHTRLRDGTCIPVTGLTQLQCVDKPAPLHTFNEPTLCKWTWDECYDEAFDDAPVVQNK